MLPQGKQRGSWEQEGGHKKKIAVILGFPEKEAGKLGQTSYSLRLEGQILQHVLQILGGRTGQTPSFIESLMGTGM